MRPGWPLDRKPEKICYAYVTALGDERQLCLNCGWHPAAHKIVLNKKWKEIHGR